MDGLRIEIENESKKVLFDESRASGLLRQILTDAGVERGFLEIAIVDNPTIHRLNTQFLGHDYPTDVLAFELERDCEAALLEGNVIVSDETALERAADYGWPPENELLLYVVHGTLHLVGYDDHAPEDEQLMRAKEREYLGRIGIAAIAGADDLGKR